MPLSAKQRDDFQELGFFRLGRIFSEAELDSIRKEYDRLLARPVNLAERGKTPFEFNPMLHVQSELMRGWATALALVETAVELLGPDVRLYWDQAVAKPAGATSDVPWHQDNGYGAVVPAEYVTFTVAIDAATLENGCLWIQSGSHKRGPQPHRPTDGVFFRGYEGAETGVPLEQALGEVLAFSSLTLHRSGPNQSAGPRRSWIIQYCHGHARHGDTGVAFDDRLLAARGGVRLAEPYRERPLDVSTIAGYPRR